MDAIITCSECQHAKIETIREDACQFFYECANCHTVLRPKPGDCCVFCSYSPIRCPSAEKA